VTGNTITRRPRPENDANRKTRHSLERQTLRPNRTRRYICLFEHPNFPETGFGFRVAFMILD
jgi:hypothetical protein